MRSFSAQCKIALALAVLGLGGHAAQAQVAPVQYWIPGGLFFGSGSTDGGSAATYGDVPGFDAADTNAAALQSEATAFRAARWPAVLGGTGSPERARSAISAHCLMRAPSSAINFKGAGGVPVTFFAGVETLNYNPDVFSALTSMSPTSTASGAYRVNAGVEFRPTSNLSLSVSAGFAQPAERVDSDIRSTLLPGETPMFSGGRR